MNYLLDTAPWLNAITLPETLPPRIRDILEAPNAKGLCSVSLLETATLYRLGRLEFDGVLPNLFAAGFSADLKVLELTSAIAAKTNELPVDFHGDPFDRTIVATAMVLGLKLITSDSAIRDSKLCEVEFYPFKPFRGKK